MADIRPEDIESVKQGTKLFFTCVMPLALVLSLCILAAVWPTVERMF